MIRTIFSAIFDKCSHDRAHNLFLESLSSNFTAIHCDSHLEIQCGKCTFDDVTATMGGDITATSPKPYGIFYLETKDKSPYIIPDYNSFNKTVVIDSCPDIHE